MSSSFPHVFSPIRVAGHLLKNRLISGPSTIHSASNGEPYPTEEAMRFFEDRAKAGIALVTCAGASLGPAFNDGEHASWDLTRPNCTNKLAELVERIHLHNAKASMELIGILPEGWTVSDGCSIMGGPVGRGEAPLDVLDAFKQSYIDAARTLKGLGFDGILLHFGHSIPIAQFLSPLTNKRTDQYGGSTENRVRYPKEIIDGIRAAVGRDMIIEVRISGDEFWPGGITLEEGIRVGTLLQDNVDILQVSAGMHNANRMTVTHPCGFLPPIPNIYLADAFKKSGQINKPVSTIGGIGSLADAEDILAQGKADFVIMARALVADPELIHKGLEGRQEDVTPCVKCMRCHDSTVYGRHFQCAVNPQVGMELVLDKFPSPHSRKKVAIIGGGPAGMKAALTAADRGHTVTLFEQSDALGGALKFADYVSFKYPLKNYKDFLVRQVEKSDVTVKLNAAVSPADVTGFDAVIAAVGATPLIPLIPGIENAKVATDIYGKETSLGNRVVVIGGGQVGCETALHLAKLGKQITVIEMQRDLAPDASKTHRDELMVELSVESNFSAICSAKVTAVTASSITYEKDGKNETIAADAVVLAAGMKPLTAEADTFMGITPQYSEIGDCVRARTAEWATKDGYYAALNIL